MNIVGAGRIGSTFAFHLFATLQRIAFDAEHDVALRPARPKGVAEPAAPVTGALSR